ncbi:MAG: NAD(P)/FAD-dependent oxidoreductase [Candidatus Margulisiibacteriota bacterium]|jgi:dihydrolipoamide dehydrogenase
MKADLAIIGGGPAGYTAALAAAKAGPRVILFEKHKLGGTCLNYGCIPTKTILESTNLFSKLKKANYFGVSVDKPSIDLPRIIQRKNIVVSKLVKSLEQEMAEGKIEVVNQEITLTEALAQANKVLICTGTSPKVLPGTISTDEALALTEVPAQLQIVGAGAVGLEMATIFNQLGAKVTICEAATQILPNAASPQITKKIQAVLEKHGLKINLNTPYSPVIASESEAISSKERAPLPLVLSCLGRIMNNQGLADAGIALGSRGEVIVNQYLQTNLPNVYAAGDITGKLQLAHVAYMQGAIAAANLLGGKKTMDYSAVPFCVFIDPVFASVGEITGPKLREVPFSALGTSQAKGNTEGFLNLVLDEQELQILGIQIFGSAAAELISTATLLIKERTNVARIRETIWAHPTLSEIFNVAFE